MKWITVCDNKDDYGRWRSTDDRYTIQRFYHKDGEWQKDPYFCIYAVWDRSQHVGEVNSLEEAQQLAEKYEEEHG